MRQGLIWTTPAFGGVATYALWDGWPATLGAAVAANWTFVLIWLGCRDALVPIDDDEQGQSDGPHRPAP